MSLVRGIYGDVKSATMGEEVEGWQEEIFKYASKSKHEKEDLINIFYEENQDLDNKLFLADILVQLKCKKIIPELKKVLENSDREHQIWAATNLIVLGDEIGIGVIRKIAKTANKNELDFITEMLCDAKNKIATELIIELAHKYEVIKNSVNLTGLEAKLIKYQNQENKN
jgi:hypothetical protein